MNVLKRELIIARKTTIFWSLAMLVLMITSMAKYQTISADGGQAIKSMMESFPTTIQAIFGMNGLDMITVSGYFGVCYLFAALVCGVHAAITGANVMSSDAVYHVSEFSFVKPRSRSYFVTSKMLAGLVIVLIIWLSTVAGSIVGVEKFATFSGFWPDFWLMMSGLLIIQLTFFAFGLFSSVFGSRRAVQISSGIVLASYLLYIFSNLSTNLSWLKYLSIFDYFSAQSILQNGGLDYWKIVICVIVVTLSASLTYVFWRNRDIEA